jgi:hypothetical protein
MPKKYNYLQSTHGSGTFYITNGTKIRNPILLRYDAFYTVYDKGIGVFQILYLQDISW